MTYNWNKSEIVKVGIRGDKPKIMIRKAGSVHLNSSFVRENNIQDKKYVRALIIKEKEGVIIGLIFLDKKEENTLKLAFGKEKKNAGFSGRSIFTAAGFNTEKKAPVSFEPRVEEYQGNKIFVFELST